MTKIFTNNAGFKIASLVLAVLTWFFVKNITSERRIIEDVPLEIKTPSGVAITHMSPSAVNVTLAGTRDDVRQVNRKDILVSLELPRRDRTGDWTVPLRLRMVHAPSRVQVVQIIPDQVDVTTEQLVDRELQVQPQLMGHPPAGYKVTRITVNPTRAHIKGPSVVLKNMSEIQTLPIDVTGRRTSFREMVQLASPYPSASFGNQQSVEVDVQISTTGSVDNSSSHGVQDKP